MLVAYRKTLLIFIAVIGSMGLVYAQTTQVIYVNKGTGNAGNGSSWTNAYADLQQALSAAGSITGDKEIWVASGDYKPTSGADRTLSFQIPANTRLYGGFAGTETVLTARDWRTNRTVLSGDVGTQFVDTDNSYHVVTITTGATTVTLDGFVITKGNASFASGNNDSGGGLLIVASSAVATPVIRNCEFLENKASAHGGAVANISNGLESSPQFINCIFNGNAAAFGGAVSNDKITGTNAPTYVNCTFSSNRASQYGGAMANFGSGPSLTNCTLAKNQGELGAGGVYNTSGAVGSVRNSILWQNFKGAYGANDYEQILNQSSTLGVKSSIVQGGYGTSVDGNINENPLFIREPTFKGLYPRTSVIPVQGTGAKYENQLRFSGERMPGCWTYYTYKDHKYNKLYLTGQRLQVIDLNTQPGGLPTSTIHYELSWGRTQLINRSIWESGDKIFFGSVYTGLISIDRATQSVTTFDPLAGEPITYSQCKVQDIVIDNNRNLLYAPVFYFPNDALYGILELDLTTNTKRWITRTSTPVSIPEVNPIADDDRYWNGHRLLLDDDTNTLYYSMGNGVWWWNRNNNTTGVYSTAGGIPLVPGNPGLPSDFATGMFIDRTENKFYIGTLSGLFVWDRKNNTSRVYNKDNSALVHNLINNIDKNEEQGLIYVSCEYGGMLEINTNTGAQRLYTKDKGNELNPQLVDTNMSSVYFDPLDKRLYVSADSPNGGVWVKDYNDLITDYGDLGLRISSPAIDKADQSFYPVNITVDISGNNRFVNFPSIFGSNSLDIGASEVPFQCQQATIGFQSDRANRRYEFTPIVNGLSGSCNVSYQWNFGDGTTSTESNPLHFYVSPGDYSVSLKVIYSCDGCSTSELSLTKTLTVDGLCDAIHCDMDGRVGIGTTDFATGYRLSVAGKMVVEEARVSAKKRWPDYVFDDSYQLMSLRSLKKYIHKNGHLPGIRSAEEMAKAGSIDAAEMSIDLLKKTEELTIHIIQLDARLKKLEQANH